MKRIEDLTFLTLYDIVKYIEEVNKDSILSRENAAYNIGDLIHGKGRSLAILYRSGYSDKLYIGSEGIKTIPITIHLLSDKDDSRSEFIKEVEIFYYKLINNSIYYKNLKVKGKNVWFLKSFRDIVSLGINEHGQQHFLIDVDFKYYL